MQIRLTKQIIMMGIDSILLVSIILLSFSLRLGVFYVPAGNLILVILAAPIIGIPIFIYFGLYRAVIRYIGVGAIWSIIKATSLYAGLWGLLVFFSSVDTFTSEKWISFGVPRSILIINWFLSISAIGGIRLLAREILSSNFKFYLSNSGSNSNQKRALIYGARTEGVQLVSALEHNSFYQVVGFFDNSSELIGQQIKGYSIYSVDIIKELAISLKVDEILIALPSPSKKTLNHVINKLDDHSVVVRIIPSVTDLARGNLSVEDLKTIDIKDLLGRSSVSPNLTLLGKNINNKVVMVTGAGGSIGSELCRQILLLRPKSIILFELNELALYIVEKELKHHKILGVEIYPVLGNINNKKRLTDVMTRFNVDTIYHAAAYKHVPMVELNSPEGVDNNVFGTLKCAQAAIDTKVKTFVLISTDKAVRPANTMGASKRVAELILQALSSTHNITLFSMVRFGNVLGSSGSVIPLFQKQINNGGPLTITDPNMVRYFMTIPEAVELVIQAGAMGKGGDVFVLDMGSPIKIYDLAKKMINLSGLSIKNDKNPSGDIKIEYIGIRPGEKLYEELLVGNNVKKTENKLIMGASEEMIEWRILEPILNDLNSAIEFSNHLKVRELLIKIVPGFNPQSPTKDLLDNDLEK